MSNPDITAADLAKPERGSNRTRIIGKKRSLKSVEESIMRESKKLDRYRCRVPRCEFRHLTPESCHEEHRGMGGNPKGDRTTLETTITMCPTHHERWDHGKLEIEKYERRRGLRGACAFYAVAANGRRSLIGWEKAPGVEGVGRRV